MKRKLASILAVALTNCALMSHGTQQTISVTSDPAGAHAEMTCDGRPAGESNTPGAITIKRHHDVCDLTFTKEGYDTANVALTSAPSKSFWANFGVIGAVTAATAFAERGNNIGMVLVFPAALLTAAGTLLVDKLSGAYYEWSPSAVNATLHTRSAEAAPVRAREAVH